MHKFKLAAILLSLVAGLSIASGAFADDTQSSANQKQAVPSHRAAHDRASKAAEPQGMIDINTADAKSLTSLKGIGEKRAQAIIQYRTEHGSFKSVDELSKIKGISKKIIDKNRDHLTVS